MINIPATIDLNPSGHQPTASVIWMHGLGADGGDFVPVVEQFTGLQDRVRFVFPHAPIRPVTVNGGMKMRAWYDIAAVDVAAAEDQAGIKHSAQLIHLLIEREQQQFGIAPSNIVLAGFSQGGAMALYVGLRYPSALAGIIALSAYLPLIETVEAERHPANRQTPIFMAHGLQDTIVPLTLAQGSRMRLETLDYKIAWHSYSMPHSVIPEEIDDIYRFLEGIL